MKHRVDHRKLGKTSSHRKAMLNNMATSLFKHERIQTTLPKAKELKRYAEKLITRAKNDTTHSRRIVFRAIRDKEVITKLFGEIAPRFADRNGGYTRILKLDFRMADAAPTAVIELVGTEKEIKSKDKKTAKEAPKKTKAKDVADKKAEKEKAPSTVEEIHDPGTTSDAVFKKGKAKDGAREAFMDKSSDSDVKAEKKKKIFEKWRKKEEPKTLKKEDKEEEKEETEVNDKAPKAEVKEQEKGTEEPKAEVKEQEKGTEEPKAEVKDEIKEEVKKETKEPEGTETKKEE